AGLWKTPSRPPLGSAIALPVIGSISPGPDAAPALSRAGQVLPHCPHTKCERHRSGCVARAARALLGCSGASGYGQERLNATQRNRSVALLRTSGFEDGPALTVQSTDGEIPHGRELSFAWLTGTVMTGLTSVLLMGAALYVSFEGQ